MAVQDRYTQFLIDQRHHYDELVTEDWETFLHSETQCLWRFEVARLFRRVHPSSILNLGCGCGFHDYEMARRSFVERIDSVDYSEKSIQKANEAFPHPKVNRWVQDFYDLQLPQAYDLVCGYQVIEHLDKPEMFLAQCKKHCKPEGVIAIFSVNRLRPYNRNRMHYGKPAELDDPMHHREYTVEELEEMGRASGLTALESFHYAVSKPALSFYWSLWMGYWLPSQGTRLAILFRNGN